MIKPEDDFFHGRNDDPYWNESAWFSFMAPDAEINGFVYFWHRPNLGLTQGGVTVWDPNGAEVHDCLFHEYDGAQPFSKGADMYDFTSDSPLTVQCIEPLGLFDIAYNSVDCRLQLEWNCIMDPLEAPVVDPGVLDPTCEGWGRGHFEQGGRVRGTLTIPGEGLEIGIDCFGVRDRTWGARRMRHDMPRQGYDWAIASEESSFLIHAVNGLPPEEDALAETVEDHLRGWYFRDGVRAEMLQGERRVVERDSRGRPVRVVVEGTDELGRSLRAEGRRVNVLRYPCHSFWVDNWALFCWHFDGRQAWGEDQDFVQLQQNRRYLRNFGAKLLQEG